MGNSCCSWLRDTRNELPLLLLLAAENTRLLCGEPEVRRRWRGGCVGLRLVVGSWLAAAGESELRLRSRVLSGRSWLRADAGGRGREASGGCGWGFRSSDRAGIKFYWGRSTSEVSALIKDVTTSMKHSEFNLIYCYSLCTLLTQPCLSWEGNIHWSVNILGINRKFENVIVLE